MKLKLKNIVMMSCIYLILPIIIFFMTWLKLYIGLACSLALITGFVFFIKDYRNDDRYIELSMKQLVITIVIILAFTWISGSGGFFVQSNDNPWRNAIFRDLINYQWPVIYTNGNKCALVYYLVYWLVPAIFGKIFGWSAGCVSLFVWTFLGIFLSTLMIIYLTKADTSTKRVFTVCAFVACWSGLNILGFAISTTFGFCNYSFGIIGSAEGWLDYSRNGYDCSYLYRCNLDALSQVYNQTVMMWVVMPIFLENRKIKNYAFLGLLVLPSGPIPFVGVFILLLLDACAIFIKEIIGREYKQLKLLSIFSIQNICAIISILPICYFFFTMNTAASDNSGSILFVPWEAFDSKRILTLILFYLIEFGIYCLLIYKKYKRDILYWIIIFSLVVIPFFKVGGIRDFCMNASLPALYILMIYFIKFIFETEVCGKILWSMVGIVLFLAFASPFGQLLGNMWEIRTTHTFPIVKDSVQSLSRAVPELNTNFLRKNYEQYPFYKYIAREKTQKDIEYEDNVYKKYLDKLGLNLDVGRYRISPCVNDSLFMTYLPNDNEEGTYSIVLSDNDYLVDLVYANSYGKYHLVFSDAEKSYLDVPQGTVYDDGKIWLWYGNGLFPQMFSIVEESGYYMITWEDKYALAYDGNRVYIEQIGRAHV